MASSWSTDDVLPPVPIGTVTDTTWQQYVSKVAEATLPALNQLSNDRPVLAALAIEALGYVPAHVVTRERIEVLRAVAMSRLTNSEAFAGIDPALEALRFARLFGDKLMLARTLSTVGLTLGDSVDIAGAIEFQCEALDLAVQLGNVRAQCALYLNIGASFGYGAQYGDAIRCFERALALSSLHSDLEAYRGLAHSAVASACLHQGDISRGLDSARRAVEAMSRADDPLSVLNLVAAETHYTRLLLEICDYDSALKHSEAAHAHALRLNSPRALLQTSTTRSLVDCARGRHDIGLTRLNRQLEQARSMRTELVDCLQALAAAYEYAGDASRAEPYVRELVLHRQAQQCEFAGNARLAALLDTLRPAFGTYGTPAGHVRLDEEDTPQWRTISRMAVAAVMRIDVTCEHGFRTGRLSSLMAERHGLPPEQCRAVELAGQVHDIGMASLPASLFGDRADSATMQRNRMRQHTEYGAALLERVPLEIAHFCAEVARNHHERFDGRGYPLGVMGSQRSFAARLVAAANEFDMLVQGKPKQRPRSVDEALAELNAQRWKKFEPDVIDLCVAVVQQLRAEVPNVSDCLAAEARGAPFIEARQQMHNLLNAAVAS